MATDRQTMDRIAERVRAALDSADLASYGELLDPDVYWGPPGDDRSGCHNRAQVLAWYERGREAGGRATVTEMVAGEDRLLVGLRVTGTAGAGGGATDRWQVLRVRDGLVVDIRGFDRREDAVAHAGLAG